MALAVAKQHLSEVKKLNNAAKGAASALRRDQNLVEGALNDLSAFVKAAQASLDESGLREKLSPEMIAVLRNVYQRAFVARDRTLELLEIIVLDMRYVEAAREDFKAARRETRDLPPKEQPKVLSQLDKGMAAADKYLGILKDARARGETQLRTLDLILDLAEERSLSAITELMQFAGSSFSLALAVFVGATAGPAGLAFIGIAWPIIDFVVDFVFGLPTAFNYLAGKFRD